MRVFSVRRGIQIEWNLSFVRLPSMVKAALSRDIGTVTEGSNEDKRGVFLQLGKQEKN